MKKETIIKRLEDIAKNILWDDKKALDDLNKLIKKLEDEK